MVMITCYIRTYTSVVVVIASYKCDLVVCMLSAGVELVKIHREGLECRSRFANRLQSAEYHGQF